MYDINDKMKKFYREKVVLSKSNQKGLIDKKNLNLKRLKDGLKEYNDENNTDYQIVDEIVQGSVAMQTIVQSEENDYDIDIGITFNKDNLPEPVTSENNTKTVKNIIHEALLKKASCFKNPPEKLTNCIRVIYEEGYHIDFAIYRRHKNDKDEYVYEHCGADWLYRNPRSITKWFKAQDKAHNYNLKKVARLIKAYLKQDSSWNVPGGLIQSVLINECIKESNRLDEMLYNTIQSVIDRLDEEIEVYNPVDVDEEGNEITLLRKGSHRDSMTKMKNYLQKGINKLSVLFEDGCTEGKALRAWGDFFNHPYWAELADNLKEESDEGAVNKSLNESLAVREKATMISQVYDYRETEEFIEDLFPISNKVLQFNINCNIEQNGFRIDTLINYIRNHLHLKANKKLHFSVPKLNILGPYDIYWKVLNRGIEAEKRDMVRGEIEKGNSTKIEHTQFSGEHSVYCYIIKNNECIAIGSVDVPIQT